jgi:exopolysaccharide biosynthesis protein
MSSDYHPDLFNHLGVRYLKIVKRMIFILLYTCVSSSLLLFHGPFNALKTYVLGEFATSRHAYLLRPLSLFTISQQTINQYKPDFATQNVANTNLEQLHKNFQTNDASITVSTIHHSTFTAYVMEVRDPKRIRVAVTKYRGKVGQTVSDMVQENGAVAGVNGGAFADANYQGTGGIPKGITIANGQLVESHDDGSIIGFTKGGAMIAGMYSAAQLQQMGVDEALTFGPILIQNGHDVIQGSGNTWAWAPRTAVGQTKDGTVIFVVTDGRYIHGPNNAGASMQDLAQIMLQYHCYVAANLDGGSSSTMVNNGKLVNQPTDVLGEREVATSVMVMPEQGGAS